MQENDLNILLRKPRTLDDEFFRAFGKLYYSLKNEGYIPIRITDIMTKQLSCSKKTYYHYLKISREKKFVTDSYEENTRVKVERQRKLLQSAEATGGATEMDTVSPMETLKSAGTSLSKGWAQSRDIHNLGVRSISPHGSTNNVGTAERESVQGTRESDKEKTFSWFNRIGLTRALKRHINRLNIK